MTNYDPISLAASYMLHRVTGNEEGQNAVTTALDEATDPNLLGAFIQHLADFGIAYGLRVHGEDRAKLHAQLQEAVMHFESTDYNGGAG